jgi:hypothetical protein
MRTEVVAFTLVVLCGLVVVGMLFASQNTASKGGWRSRLPRITINKKKWKRHLLSGWGIITASVFLFVTVGAGVWIIRHNIEPGDLRPPEKIPGWAPKDVDRTMTQARRLIEACYAYRERYGRFPTRLDMLAPEFTPSIERPATGLKNWTYATYNRGQALYLSFAANHRFYPARSYASGRVPSWSFDE